MEFEEKINETTNKNFNHFNDLFDKNNENFGIEIISSKNILTNNILRSNKRYNEGFDDLTNDKVSCDLLSAVFGVKVSVNPMGLTTSQNFFTGTTLVSAPSDNLYYDTVKNLLLTIPGVGGVTIDALNNQITVRYFEQNKEIPNQGRFGLQVHGGPPLEVWYRNFKLLKL